MTRIKLPRTAGDLPLACLIWLSAFFVFLIASESIQLLRFISATSASQMEPTIICFALGVALLTNFVALSVLCQKSTMGMARRVYGCTNLFYKKLEILRQTAAPLIFWGAMITCCLFACLTAFWSAGIGDWLTNWLFYSICDANLSGSVLGVTDGALKFQFPDYDCMHNLVRTCLALCLILLPLRYISQSSVFVTTLTQRIYRRIYATVDSAVVDALRIPQLEIQIFDERPALTKILNTLGWLLVCYLFLFWLFGFSGGAIGHGIAGFLESSIRDAWHSSFANLNPVRPFLGALVASYATVPFAVMTSVLLPLRKPGLISLSADSILFYETSLLSLHFRIFRMMDDVKQVSLQENKSDFQSSTLCLTFATAGTFRCRLKQMEKRALYQFLKFVDENATQCIWDANVLALKQNLSREVPPGSNIPNYGAGEDLESNDSSAFDKGTADFKSTLFPLHAPDAILQPHDLRIVKQLSIRSVSATYLVRNNDGLLCVLKQHLIASDAQTTETGSDSDSNILCRFNVRDSNYFIYQYIPGEDLRSLICRSGASREFEVIEWASQIATIMDARHKRNGSYVFGALKPSRLILDRSGFIHLVGAASTSASRSRDRLPIRAFVGEHAYVAPEQLRGQPDERSDIYSFGCILFYLLTGRHPDALKSSDLTSENIPLSGWLIQLIRSCTAFERSERPESFAEIWLTLQSHQSLPEHLASRREASAQKGRISPVYALDPVSSSEAQTPTELILKLSHSVSNGGEVLDVSQNQERYVS